LVFKLKQISPALIIKELGQIDFRLKPGEDRLQTGNYFHTNPAYQCRERDLTSPDVKIRQGLTFHNPIKKASSLWYSLTGVPVFFGQFLTKTGS
jgi:hypothetical protein